ncbi:MAG: hypothetical protein ACQESR_04825 [Planctomycetota bacterium]
MARTVMFFTRFAISKLLVWLAAAALPMQLVWVDGCGCGVAAAGEMGGGHGVSSTGMSGNDGDGRASSKPAASRCEGPGRCCQSKATAPKSCCDGEPRACACGDSCYCLDCEESPEPPVTPASDSERGEGLFQVLLALSGVTLEAVAEEDRGLLVANVDVGCHLPATRRCALLCRFTL